MTEQITIEKDIAVGCVTARTFPEGVLEAHQKLHTLVPFDQEKRYFGLSRPENGAIIYRAAVELEPEAADRLALESMIVKKGTYIRQKIENYKQDISSIGRTFEKLLERPDLDPLGYCVELYDNAGHDVWCMIRLDQTDPAKIEVAVDCGNSPKMQFLKDFNIAFAREDIDALSAAVTEDIRWNMVGDQLIEGKADFTAALREMSGEKPAAMRISKVVTHGKTGAVNGQLIMQNGKKYAFCDVYEFKSVKGDRIASIDSYVIELKP